MFVLLQLPKSTTAAHSAKEINPGNNTMALVFSIRILWYCNFNVFTDKNHQNKMEINNP